MSDTERDDGPDDLRWPDVVDEVFGRANPNPTREGCLPADKLRALARRERKASDPGYVHLTQCSPCYLEVRRFYNEFVRERRRHRYVLVVAAALALVVGVCYMFSR